jgi:hypothetical protein
VTPGLLDDFIGWAQQIEGVFRRLCVVPELVNESLDPDFAVCFPYLQRVSPGDSFDLDVQVTNHAQETRRATAELVLPEGWSAEPTSASASVAPAQMVPLSFRVQTASGDSDSRHVAVADLTFGERHYGQRAEAIVDVTEQAPR